MDYWLGKGFLERNLDEVLLLAILCAQQDVIPQLLVVDHHRGVEGYELVELEELLLSPSSSSEP